ncbi:adenosine/AMP deaminase [Lasiosphaeris hirsuta]|uniref:adenosine deaminase n=1 Tax=Lasiosphaeris hirsuta TaxID=260670 RepID=A0AA40A327_9PEZI|nr:adenosine/AMP deaminase [Lasiosphaeris hirsuta]
MKLAAMVKKLQKDKPPSKPHRPQDGVQYDVVAQYDIFASRRLLGRQTRSKSKTPPAFNLADRDAYDKKRREVLGYESALAFDHHCKVTAPEWEVRANEILLEVKRRDVREIYDAAPPRRGYGGQMHPRFFGDHFLSNIDLIEDTRLFEICRAMPKGAHLHIHFNANLVPGVLIKIAKKMEHMYISSDIPLLATEGREAFDLCKIQFSILNAKAVQEQGGVGNIFDKDYSKRRPMLFEKFRQDFSEHYAAARRQLVNGNSPGGGETAQARKVSPKMSAATKAGKNSSEESETTEEGVDLARHPTTEDRRGDDTVDHWLYDKLVFCEEETYNALQTANGAWEKFNGRTQMMKGLFNYETAYKEYTQLCLQEFVDDNIQYAEIRPNFMSTNQVWKDDGSTRIDNWGIMELIIKAYEAFQQSHKQRVLKGLKIIYCTPRSFDAEKVKASLDECLRVKLQYPEWIAGFDLVGEESKGRPLKDFIEEFLQFKKDCKEEKVDIPFLFHCGETLDIGTDTDENLVDALLLGSKRIGHGFALPRHPYIMEQMKRHKVCVEVCPISNEVLGLTPRANGHAMFNLLANNVHCTVSTDNGTPFRSRLSHDFYQAMAGKSDMTLHGWRQLIEWSLEHSCLEDDRRAKIRQEWETMWQNFCKWIVEEYGPSNSFRGEGRGPPVPSKESDSIKR